MNDFARGTLFAGLAGLGLIGPAQAVDFTTGDWKFSLTGEVNVHYVYSSCDNATAAPIVTVGGACVGTASGTSTSSVGNGLLPADINFGVSTTQNGYDLGAHFGFYPGIASNDGGSPNLQATAGPTNVALATTGLDIRQVYLTFGNKDIGTFLFGRNFGLFGFDAIINDMTIPGVGVAGGLSGASPANTSLGSIGFGYIYTDTLAQMDYSTPDLSGFGATVGIFEPVNSLTTPGSFAPKKAPGVHGKLTYTTALGGGAKLYLSATVISQKQNYNLGATAVSYNSTGVDVFAKVDVGGFQGFASYYHGSGMGTTALFVLADDGNGNTRDSYGYLVQGTYKVGAVKFGVNYGVSQLDFANAADRAAVPNLLQKNSKVTGGVYYSLTPNLTLLAEATSVKTEAHNGGSNKSNSVNVGAFLGF